MLSVLCELLYIRAGEGWPVLSMCPICFLFELSVSSLGVLFQIRLRDAAILRLRSCSVNLYFVHSSVRGCSVCARWQSVDCLLYFRVVWCGTGTIRNGMITVGILVGCVGMTLF